MERNGEQGLWFVLKSDASSSGTTTTIPANHFIGKVIGNIPGMGLVINIILSPGACFIILLLCWASAALLVLLAWRERRSKSANTKTETLNA